MWSLRQTQTVDEKEAIVYLANLDKSIGEKTLRDTFSAFGSVTSCTVLSGCESSSTAAITFDTREAAKKAIKVINECLWNGEQM
jgi:polyadenylate-binding protein